MQASLEAVSVHTIHVVAVAETVEQSWGGLEAHHSPQRSYTRHPPPRWIVVISLGCARNANKDGARFEVRVRSWWSYRKIDGCKQLRSTSLWCCLFLTTILQHDIWNCFTLWFLHLTVLLQTSPSFSFYRCCTTIFQGFSFRGQIYLVCTLHSFCPHRRAPQVLSISLQKQAKFFSPWYLSERNNVWLKRVSRA